MSRHVARILLRNPKLSREQANVRISGAKKCCVRRFRCVRRKIFLNDPTPRFSPGYREIRAGTFEVQYDLTRGTERCMPRLKCRDKEGRLAPDAGPWGNEKKSHRYWRGPVLCYGDGRTSRLQRSLRTVLSIKAKIHYHHSLQSSKLHPPVSSLESRKTVLPVPHEYIMCEKSSPCIPSAPFLPQSNMIEHLLANPEPEPSRPRTPCPI